MRKSHILSLQGLFPLQGWHRATSCISASKRKWREGGNLIVQTFGQISKYWDIQKLRVACYKSLGPLTSLPKDRRSWYIWSYGPSPEAISVWKGFKRLCTDAEEFNLSFTIRNCFKGRKEKKIKNRQEKKTQGKKIFQISKMLHLHSLIPDKQSTMEIIA